VLLNYKLLSLAIMRKLETYVTDIISKYQCSSTRRKLTTDHIFTIRYIMEKYCEHDDDLLIVVDFKQAYDSIN